MIFAQNVARIKREQGLTDGQLAAGFGISEKTIKRILSNTRSNNRQYVPSYRTVRRVADALKVSSDDVFKYHVYTETI